MTSTRRVTSVGWGRGTTTDRWSVVGQDAGDVEHVVGLEAEVELLDDGLGEQLDQRRRVGQGGDGDAADEVGGDPAHGGQIRPHGRGDRGPLHFHHHLFAGTQGGGVDLGDRRGGQRRPGRNGGRPPPGAGPDPPRPRPGRRRTDSGGTRSRRSRNSLDQLRREEALAGGEDLAQLDVGGARGSGTPSAAGGTGRPGTASGARAGGCGGVRSGTSRPGPGPARRRPGPPAGPAGAAACAADRGPGRRWSARSRSRPARQCSSSGSISQGGVS